MKSLKSPFLVATASMLLSVGVCVSSANASQPKSLPSVTSATGIISNGFNFCLGLGTSVKTGSPIFSVVNVSCTANASVVVTKSATTNGYTIAVGDKCLFLASRANGSDLFASTCALSANWIALPAGGIGLVPISGDGTNTNFCMDVENGTPKIGSPIQIYTCQGLTAGNIRIPAQRWTYPEALFNQSPYPYPEQTSPQPIPVSPTSTPKTCNNVGMCTVADVRERVSLITAVKDIADPSLPKPNLIEWNTEEPWYGKEANKPFCSIDSFQYDNKYATNFALSSQRNDRSWNIASVLGTMFRVRNEKFIANRSITGSYLKSVTVQTTYEGLCQRYYADANGWIIIPRYCNYCILYGFKNDQWPKNSIVEVAEISANGRGGSSTVFVKNPRELGPSRATCRAIVGLGFAKETLKFATNLVAERLPPPSNEAAQAAISYYFQVIEYDPKEPQRTKTLAAFGNVDSARKLYNQLRVLKGLPVIPILSGKTVEFVSSKLDLASVAMGAHSVVKDYKNICG